MWVDLNIFVFNELYDAITANPHVAVTDGTAGSWGLFDGLPSGDTLHDHGTNLTAGRLTGVL